MFILLTWSLLLPAVLGFMQVLGPFVLSVQHQGPCTPVRGVDLVNSKVLMRCFMLDSWMCAFFCMSTVRRCIICSDSTVAENPSLDNLP